MNNGVKEFTIKCTLETRTSKNGNEYEALVLKLAPEYEKLVFLDSAEKVLLKQTYNK